MELLPDRWPWRTATATWLGTALPAQLAGPGAGGLYPGLYGQPGDPLAAMVPDGPQPKTETLRGRRLEPGTHRLAVPAGADLAVLALAPTDLVLADLGLAGGHVPLPVGRWRHLRFDARYDGTLAVTAPVVLADPVPLAGGAGRLVLLVFVDGLAQAVLAGSDLMPATDRFFAPGLRFANCYATGEWTQSSVATVHTGRYLSGHNMFHPRRPMALPAAPVLAERMRAAGYATISVGGNWRATPGYGYARGFDRTVYQKNLPGMQVIGDLLDQLDPLGGRDVFAAVSFMDVHWKCEDVLPDVGTQLAKTLRHQLREARAGAPLPMYQGGWDAENIDAYLAQLRRLDRVLAVLFDALARRHPDATVLLYSDHGQSFDSRFAHSWELSDRRLRVPLLLRGPGVPAGVPDELVELVDVQDILGAATGLDLSTVDGQVPARLGGTAREYAYAETRYPGRLFRAAVTRPGEKFLLCSEGTVDQDGMFDLGRPHLQAYRLDSEEGELDPVSWDDRWTEVIVERAGAWMRDRDQHRRPVPAGRTGGNG
jgi:Sulfatase